MPRLDSFFLTLPTFFLLTNTNVKLLYWLKVVREVLNNVTFIFLPIFLFSLKTYVPWIQPFGLSEFQIGILIISLFFTVQRIVIFLTAIPLSKMMAESKIETSLFISYLLRIVVFLALYFSIETPSLLFVAAIAEGLQANFFWSSFFTVLTKHMSEKVVGKEFETRNFLVQIVIILSPIFSGYFAYHFGLQVILLLGVVLCLVSAAIITGISLKIKHDSVSWQGFIEWIKRPSFVENASFLVGRYLNDTVLFLWPLYVFIVLGTIERVGFLYTFSLFLALVLSFLIGGFVNTIATKKRPLILSGGTLAFIWLARTQLLSVWGMALADAFEKLFSNPHWRFFDVAIIKKAKNSQAFSYFVYREMMISIIALVFWVGFFVIFMLTTAWTALFIFAGIGVLLSLLVTRTIHEKNFSPALDV